MRITYILQLLLCSSMLSGQLVITEMGQLPEPVTNNAVCEGFINGTPYVYSFGGLDVTKTSSGIHQRSFRYNTVTGTSEAIPSLPDNRGKIASAASRIGNIIYITGGYYVNTDGTEISSDRVHRYDIAANAYLSDGAPIPVATDDHVQGVWRDSLLYLVTGWSNSTNIRNVQIYNPQTDSWSIGTQLPSSQIYRSFGAAGVIIKDTIFYFGGATSLPGFGIQNRVRKGVIDPSDPTNIEWSVIFTTTPQTGYRMAATRVGNSAHWIGGSEETYNYDGIAYNGTGGVPTSKKVIYMNENTTWVRTDFDEIPMDLRGIALVNDTLKYLAGGMLGGQTVTDKVYKLEWTNQPPSSTFNLHNSTDLAIYPNPFSDEINIDLHQVAVPALIEIVDNNGKIILKLLQEKNDSIEIDTQQWQPGLYFVSIKSSNRILNNKIVKN